MFSSRFNQLFVTSFLISKKGIFTRERKKEEEEGYVIRFIFRLLVQLVWIILLFFSFSDSIFLDFERRCILRIVSISKLIGTRFRILCEFLRNSKLSTRLSIYYTFFDFEKISKILPRNSSCDAKIFFRRASRFFTAKIKNDQAFPINYYY